MNKTIEIEVDDYVGFCDDGSVEHCSFIGASDDPVIQSVRTLESMALEFLELRSTDGKFDQRDKPQADALCNALEDALALIRAATK